MPATRVRSATTDRAVGGSRWATGSSSRDDRSATEVRAGDGEPGPLTAGESTAARPEDRVEAVCKPGGQSTETSPRSKGLEARRRQSRRAGEREVVAQRRREDVRPRRPRRRSGPRASLERLGEDVAVAVRRPHRVAAGDRVEVASQHGEQGRFAAAVRAEDRDRLAPGASSRSNGPTTGGVFCTLDGEGKSRRGGSPRGGDVSRRRSALERRVRRCVVGPPGGSARRRGRGPRGPVRAAPPSAPPAAACLGPGPHRVGQGREGIGHARPERGRAMPSRGSRRRGRSRWTR